MEKPDALLEIQTLGRFSMHINGREVATNWPNESLKIFFCSLLSPLDLYFTWDRMCRSLWDVPETKSDRHRLDEAIIRPLGMFLVKELGYNPLLTNPEGIRISLKNIHIDAREFYSAVLDGLRLSSLADHSSSIEKFNQANLLYTGSYLPGIPGKIIENARHDLEILYRTAVMDAISHTRSK